jgi:tetratricopeptide (TPR) repeat protein
MRTRKAAWGALLLCFLLPLFGFGQDERARLDFWKTNYGELRPEDDPRVGRAHEIFARVLNAAGKRVGVNPTLFIVKGAGATVPLAIALPDGGIVISRQVLDICYKEPEKGDDRLAFVLGHEIAHQLKDDFWHLKFFAAVELSQKEKPGDAAVIEEVKKIASQSQEPLLKEMQCDEYGIVYASMAGFDTRAIVLEDDTVNFFRYFAEALDPQNIKGVVRDAEHPTPDARAAAVKARLIQVLDVVDLFDLGLLFYRTGDYEKAAELFSEFLRYYPGREVYHDLAASHHQMALRCYREWKGADKDFPFKLSLPVEAETRARKIVLRDKPAPDWEARFKEELAKAVEYYRQALALDPSYWLAANNLGCALMIQENPYEAVASLQKALQLAPESPLVNNNLGVAFQLAENPQKAKEKLLAALKLSPGYDAPIYNLGLIAFLAGDKDGAARQWQAYLKLDPAGPFAERIAANLGTAQSPLQAGNKPEAVPEKVAGLGVGDYTDAIPTDWGTPIKKKSFLGEENHVVLTVYANGVTVVAREEEILRLSVSGPFGGQTANGLTLGAEVKKVADLYGSPPTVLLSTAGDTWVYPARGIAFVVRDGKVFSWVVFKS